MSPCCTIQHLKMTRSYVIHIQFARENHRIKKTYTI